MKACLRTLSIDELKDFFVKIIPYLHLSINGEVNNQSMDELSFYLSKIKAKNENLDLRLKSLESESGTSILELSIHEEDYLCIAIFLILECLRFNYATHAENVGWEPILMYQGARFR